MLSLIIQATGTDFAIPPTPIVKREPAARYRAPMFGDASGYSLPRGSKAAGLGTCGAELGMALLSDYKELLTANGSSAIGEFLQPVRRRDDSTCQLRLEERGWRVAATGPIGDTFAEVRSASRDPS